MSKIKKAKIKLRNLQRKDFKKVLSFYEDIYDKDNSMTLEMLNGQMSRFPEGQFVVQVDDEIIGHCATFIISGDLAFKDHSWSEITGGGYASRHNEDGDYLYGMEVGVDPNYRGLRIGQRLYERPQKSLH